MLPQSLILSILTYLQSFVVPVLILLNVEVVSFILSIFILCFSKAWCYTQLIHYKYISNFPSIQIFRQKIFAKMLYLYLLHLYRALFCVIKKLQKNLDITKKVVPLQCISGVIHNGSKNKLSYDYYKATLFWIHLATPGAPRYLA